MKLGPYLLGPNDENQGIYTGDARELAKAIPDESVDLIFTDPVYDNIDDYQWLGKTGRRILKNGASVVAYCAHHKQITCGAAISKSLDECPILEHRILGPRGRLFPWSLICNMMPALWFSKGKPNSGWMSLQIDSFTKNRRGHYWGKNEDRTRYRALKMTNQDGVVFDPFCGGGSTPAVCKMLGRNYLAFEIDPDTAEMARKRVRETQPPLFVPEPQQMELLTV